jgi:CubicO group peptidase (beta-lactamase class C family)
MQSEVFGPLQMKSTRSALPDKVLPRRAAGYQLAGGTLENRDEMRCTRTPPAASAIRLWLDRPPPECHAHP